MDEQNQTQNESAVLPNSAHPLENTYDNLRPERTSERHSHDDIKVSWEASEYVMHHKSNMWFVWLGVVSAGLMALSLLVLNDVLATLVIAVMTAAIVVYGTRKPNTLQYSLSDEEIIVGHRQMLLSDFRSFSLLQDGGLKALWLIPLKRFAPSLTIYYPEDREEEIVEILGRHLPYEEREPDLVDRITRQLRF